jgi:hypothetical protein
MGPDWPQMASTVGTKGPKRVKKQGVNRLLDTDKGTPVAAVPVLSVACRSCD